VLKAEGCGCRRQGLAFSNVIDKGIRQGSKTAAELLSSLLKAGYLVAKNELNAYMLSHLREPGVHA
jgi:hypothetical protein